MNFIDAYLIVENYTTSLAYGQRPNEDWKRISVLKNSKDDILSAYKLVFAHAIFWNALSKETLNKYELCLKHLGDFFEDNLVSEYTEIKNTLSNKNPFTKLRNKVARAALEERKKQIELTMARSMTEGMNYGNELDKFLEWLLPAIRKVKEFGRNLPAEDLDKQYFQLVGNFVCDVYEVAHIERDFNDTEYFWPIHELFRLSNDPKFDYLFGKYKSYIANAYYNNPK